MKDSPEARVQVEHSSSFAPEPIKRNFRGKDVVSLDQFDAASIWDLFLKVHDMATIARNGWSSRILAGKIVTLLFYQPSTRTRVSFEAAVKQLGGEAIVVTDPEKYSSEAKGEVFEDSIRTYEAYCDAIVIRHPETGTALRSAEIATRVPILNAGDGIGEHPTQALLDLYTIWQRTGRLFNLKGLMAGDLLNGRTVHSLIRGLSLFPGNEVYLLSPEELRLSREDLASFQKRGIKLYEIADVSQIPGDCAFWYWTRVQKEKFEGREAEYEKVNNRFVVTQDFLDQYGGASTMLMHPFPRKGEILQEVDTDPRASYFEQIRNGMYIRMALLGLVLGKIK